MTRAVSVRQVRGGQPLTKKYSARPAAFRSYFPLFKIEPQFAEQG